MLLVYYKRYNSGTVKWKRCIGQGMGSGAQSFHAFAGCVTLQLTDVFTNLESLQTPLLRGFSGGVIM